MKIITAEKIGFCFGVRRSINMAKESLQQERERPVFLLGNIVHNEEVIQEIEAHGGKFISSLEEAKPGSLVITKAHGVFQKTLKQAQEKGIDIQDTTCPIVQTAQKKAQALKDQGYKVIIIGEKEHPEPQVIQEYAGENSLITEEEEELRGLDTASTPLGVVAQTTKKRDKVEKLIRVIKEEGKEVKWEDTICNEVSDRQKELKKLLEQTEGIVVVGSKTSANTTRLAEIVEDSGQKLWWINSLEELDTEEIKKYNTIGVVSGTSAPDWEVERIVNFLNKLSANTN